MPRPITFIRPDRTFGRADLDACEAWVQTVIIMGVLQEDGTFRPEPIDVFAFHGGHVEPTLYLAPDGSYFARRPSIETCWTLRREYVGVSEATARQWLSLNGYAAPRPAAKGKKPARVDDVQAKAIAEVMKMANRGEKLNPGTVAARLSVGRSTLYGYPDVIKAIDALNTPEQGRRGGYRESGGEAVDDSWDED